MVNSRDFPGSPVVKILCFHCRGTGLIPGQGTKGLPQWLSSKEFACNAGDEVRFLGREDPLKKGMATSILAWRIPRTQKPGGLWYIGSQNQTGL